MKLSCVLVVLSCVAWSGHAFAHSLTQSCNLPAAQVAVNCLQPKLDSRAAREHIEFEKTLEFVAGSQRDAPEAGIDAADVKEDLQHARQLWQNFTQHECAAARRLVGYGTDRNNIELICLIQLYDQRIQELESWRGL